MTRNVVVFVVVIVSDSSSVDACRISYGNNNAMLGICTHDNNNNNNNANPKFRSKNSYSYDYIITSKGIYLIQSATSTEFTFQIQYQFYSTICNTETSTWKNVINSSLGSNGTYDANYNDCWYLDK